MLPAVQQAREAARRMSCSNNMKQIGIALHNYHSAYKTLPPAYITDAEGNPLHSWRTLILPFMEQQALYQQIDFSKPWDDPVNLPYSQTVIPAYACPSTIGDPTSTTYVAVVDPSGIMSGPQATKFSEVLDGLSNTIMLVECDSDLAVPWMQPQDINLNQFVSSGTAKEAGGHYGGAHVLMADGAVTFITDSMNPQLRQVMVSKAGKEIIDEEMLGF
jgi:prepilin-type processing-associated H-X9-DG protein